MKIRSEVLKRLKKATRKSSDILSLLHVNENYIEGTDGKMLIRYYQEDSIDAEFFLPIHDIPLLSKKDMQLKSKSILCENFSYVVNQDIFPSAYPNTQEVLNAAKKKDPKFKIVLSREVLQRLVQVMPRDANLEFVFNSDKEAICVSCENIEGVIMPIVKE